MKELMQKHGVLVLYVLLYKYDKQSQPIRNQEQKSPTKRDLLNASYGEDDDDASESLATFVGPLVRLYAKSKQLSECLSKVSVLERIVELTMNKEHTVQNDAQKTFETIFKGKRISKNLGKKDSFMVWLESN